MPRSLLALLHRLQVGHELVGGPAQAGGTQVASLGGHAGHGGAGLVVADRGFLRIRGGMTRI